MTSPRRLVVIMFADIAGYTAIMANDEEEAYNLLRQNRDIQKPLIEKFNGRWLKELGDGVLASFTTASEAVDCALAIQKATVDIPDLTLRIGLHMGEVIFEESDVFGDGVNLASRISDVAPPGKIWVSETVRMSLRGRKDVYNVLAKEADLKNVGEIIKLYEVSDDPDQLKPIYLSREDSVKASVKNIWNRKVPHFLLGYLAICWILHTLAVWMVPQYFTSTNLSDKIFLFVLAMIPSIFYYTYNRKKWQKTKMSWWNKLSIPVNVVAAFLLIFLVLKGTHGQSMTTLITLTNEFGEKEKRRVIRPEFREQIPLFYFDPEIEGDTNTWLGPAIAIALGYDLDQDENITVAWPHNRGGTYRFLPSSLTYRNSNIYDKLNEKLKYAKLWQYDHFLAGSYKINNDSLYITTQVHEMPSGNIKLSKSFKGKEFFALIDEISKQIKLDFGLSPERIGLSIDAPVEDLLTNNLSAYRDFIIAYLNFPRTDTYAYYNSSLQKDSSFALASLEKARFCFISGDGRYASEQAIQLALQHRSRLSEMQEIETRALLYNIRGERDKALLLLKMQMDLNPGHLGYKDALFSQNRLMENYEENIEIAKNETVFFGDRLQTAFLFSGLFTEALANSRELNTAFPNNNDFLWIQSLTHLAMGNVEKHLETNEIISVLNPDRVSNPYTDSLEQAVLQYVNANQRNNSVIDKIRGSYRADNTGYIWRISPIPNGHGLISSSQAGLWSPSFPISDYQYTSGTSVVTFIENKNGEIDLYKQSYGKGGHVFNRFKQDSSIWEAENLLWEGKNQLALAAFQKLLNEHPDHYYLATYIEHLQFIMSEEYESSSAHFKKYAGNYSGEILDYQLRLKEGKIFFKMGSYPESPLLPLSKNTFQTRESYNFFIKFIEQAGKMKLQGLHRIKGDEVLYDEAEMISQKDL